MRWLDRRAKMLALWLLVLGASLGPLPPAAAQDSGDGEAPELSREEQRQVRRRRRERGRDAGPHEKADEGIRRLLTDVIRDAARSTVLVVRDGREAALGTVVDTRHVLTKASELAGRVTCRIGDADAVPARVVALSLRHDLALLRVETPDAVSLEPIAWPEATDPSIGSIVATVGPNGEALAIGAVSVAARELEERGVLGIRFDTRERTPLIGEVFPDTGAYRAGLQPGDLITRINGLAVETTRAVIDVLGKTAPGDTVDISVRRGAESLDVRATLGALLPVEGEGDGNDRMAALNGDLSRRRTSFPAVIQHDTFLFPVECGGPLVDLDGRLVGINIARGGRVDSYAIPASIVREVTAELLSGERSPPPSWLARLGVDALRARRLELAAALEADPPTDERAAAAREELAALDAEIHRLEAAGAPRRLRI